MIRIATVGKIRSSWLQQGCEDYLRRMRRFTRAEVVEVSDSDPLQEAKELLARARAGSPHQVVVACDREGEPWSSEDLARLLGRHGGCSFLVGGPEGLHPDARAAADHAFAMGRITLPHELARLVLLEQIYRGISILRGHPYHR